MKNENIVLYGCGLEGKRFYFQYGNELNIKFAIDRESKGNDYFYGIPKYRIEEIEDIKKHFIIVSVGNEHWLSIKHELERRGLKCDLNFIWCRWFGKKKEAVLYGNCHIDVLRRYLYSNSDFQRKYNILNYRIYDLNENNIELFKDEISHCDLLITQDIREENKFNMPSANELISITKKECISIRIPNVYRINLFWPQIDLETMSEPEDLDNIAFYVIGRGDNIIEDGYRKGKTVEEMVDIIQNSDVFSSINIKKQFEDEISKLKKREAKCDITISDFIEENYRKIQLFYEPIHPTNPLIFEKGNRILRLLGYIPEENKSQIALADGYDQQEAFIYPCVRKALELEYEQKYIRKKTGCGLRQSSLTLFEYIEDYYKVLQIGKSPSC